MRQHLTWENVRLFVIGYLLGILLVVLLTGCGNIDVNGYRAKAAEVGQPIHCKGACP